MNNSASIRFRWKFIILPVVVLVLTLILTGVFYAGLPADTAYTFESDGTSLKVMGKTGLVLWIVGIQVVLTLGAALTTFVMAQLFNRYVLQDEGFDITKIISLMGNMIAIPQVVIFFTILDIFSYNSYEIHLLPLWLNALIILLVGGVVLSIFFIRIFREFRRLYKE